MSEQEHQTPRDAPEPAGRPDEPSESSEQRTSLTGRVGGALARFDEGLSGRVPDAIESATRRAADSARKSLHSGLWHNYAFLVVLALVAIAVVVLLTRGCTTGGTP